MNCDEMSLTALIRILCARAEGKKITITQEEGLKALEDQEVMLSSVNPEDGSLVIWLEKV